MNQPITKADLLEVTAPLGAQMAALQAQMADLKGEMGGLKGEMGGLKGELAAQATSLSSQMTSLRRDTALGFDRLDTKIDRVEERLDAKLDKRYSDTISHLDGFMAQTLAVRTDQTFLIHRVDELEKRGK